MSAVKMHRRIRTRRGSASGRTGASGRQSGQHLDAPADSDTCPSGVCMHRYIRTQFRTKCNRVLDGRLSHSPRARPPSLRRFYITLFAYLWNSCRRSPSIAWDDHVCTMPDTAKWPLVPGPRAHCSPCFVIGMVFLSRCGAPASCWKACNLRRDVEERRLWMGVLLAPVLRSFWSGTVPCPWNCCFYACGLQLSRTPETAAPSAYLEHCQMMTHLSRPTCGSNGARTG